METAPTTPKKRSAQGRRQETHQVTLDLGHQTRLVKQGSLDTSETERYPST